MIRSGKHHEVFYVEQEYVITGEYSTEGSSLSDLYEKAKRQQWRIEELNWDSQFDKDNPLQMPDETIPVFRTEIWQRMTEEERQKLRRQFQSWNISQLLHGEQAAMLCAAKIAQADIDVSAKLCAASQVIDEARHMDTYSRLLRSRLDRVYPLTSSLRSLLADVIEDKRPDITCLGMQILIEGMALAIFRRTESYSRCPLVKSIFSNVLRDEARHFAMGRLLLRRHIDELSAQERAEREDFVCESSRLLFEHFCADDIWESVGIKREIAGAEVRRSSVTRSLQSSLFRQLVPAIKEMGLLGDKSTKLFEELGVLRYASFPVGDSGSLE